jgi:hypothetical protein
MSAPSFVAQTIELRSIALGAVEMSLPCVLNSSVGDICHVPAKGVICYVLLSGLQPA